MTVIQKLQMGNCSATENSNQLTDKISKQTAEAHFCASIKLDHYEKREAMLKKQAFDDVRRLVSTANQLIKSKQDLTMNEIETDIKKIQANEKDMKRIHKLGMTVEEYVGLDHTQQNIADYKQRVHSKFDNIKDELQKNMRTAFNTIRQNITNDIISFESHPELKKQQVEAQYYKWRMNNRQKCKECILELQNEFKDALTHDYFRNKLKHVVNIDDLKLALKRKPMVALRDKKKQRTDVDKTEVKMEEVQAFEIDSKSTKPGKGFWLCCMPTQSTE